MVIKQTTSDLTSCCFPASNKKRCAILRSNKRSTILDQWMLSCFLSTSVSILSITQKPLWSRSPCSRTNNSMKKNLRLSTALLDLKQLKMKLNSCSWDKLNKRNYFLLKWAHLNHLLGLPIPLGTSSSALKSCLTLIWMPTAGTPTVCCNGLVILVVSNKRSN